MAQDPKSTTILIHDDKVVVPFEIAPGVSQDREVPILDFLKNIASQAPLDTELMPVSGTGLLALRQFGKYRQVVYQVETGLSYVTWGARERDPSAGTYLVASPYRIVIADIFDGDLLGARMFYRPEPIKSPNDILYNINLPNTNCRGYGQGNCVGWLCLYHKSSWKGLTITEQILAINERAGGGEAYNDANMSRTDGARFYKQYRPNNPEMATPQAWAKKTEQEGIDWVNDPDLLLPVWVASADEQSKNAVNPTGSDYVPLDNAVLLTIDMAMRGTYKAYYYDPTPLKPINALSRDDKTLADSITTGNSSKVAPFSARAVIERAISMDSSYGNQVRERVIVQADDNWDFGGNWASGTIKAISNQTNEANEQIDFKPKPIGTCKFSGEKIYQGQDTVDIYHYGKVLKEKITDEFFSKDNKGNLCFSADLIIINEKFYHNTIPYGICSGCQTAHIVEKDKPYPFYPDAHGKISAHCINCVTLKTCDISGKDFPEDQIHQVVAFDSAINENRTYNIGQPFVHQLTVCACSKIAQRGDVHSIDGVDVCAHCIGYSQSGSPVYVKQTTVPVISTT
jgi:hypothetical protein